LIQFQSCDGEFQSPIDIISNNAVYDESLRPFNFSNLNEIIRWNTTNNGHTVLFYPLDYPDPDEISFNNYGVKETISLVQFHFHWGQNDYQGSEHYIDGKKYSGEVTRLVNRIF
jgi:carbonic anhydrase